MGDWLRETAKFLDSKFDVDVFYGDPLPRDVSGKDNNYSGFVDIKSIKNKILLSDADYYVLGPIPFMRIQHDPLRGRDIHEARTRREVFCQIRSMRNRRWL
ncbi:MAG: hypothetical protein V4793_13025 [Paraburkholderia tropica]|uniref:hypothetical protein n=1 Tax=Paraburkholderia tropica TaxID=92647 RepID=UPI00310105BA